MKSRAELELDDFEVVFAALANANRRRILVVLLGRGGSMGAGEIAERFGCAWPTTTQHLKELMVAGLVRVEKSGRSRIYHLNNARLVNVVSEFVRYFKEEP